MTNFYENTIHKISSAGSCAYTESVSHILASSSVTGRISDR